MFLDELWRLIWGNLSWRIHPEGINWAKITPGNCPRISVFVNLRTTFGIHRKFFVGTSVSQWVIHSVSPFASRSVGSLSCCQIEGKRGNSLNLFLFVYWILILTEISKSVAQITLHMFSKIIKYIKPGAAFNSTFWNKGCMYVCINFTLVSYLQFIVTFV